MSHPGTKVHLTLQPFHSFFSIQQKSEAENIFYFNEMMKGISGSHKFCGPLLPPPVQAHYSLSKQLLWNKVTGTRTTVIASNPNNTLLAQHDTTHNHHPAIPNLQVLFLSQKHNAPRDHAALKKGKNVNPLSHSFLTSHVKKALTDGFNITAVTSFPVTL